MLPLLLSITRRGLRSDRRLGLLVPIMAGTALWTLVAAQVPGRPARLIAVFVVDGLRPDTITPLYTPTLARLRAEGVEYLNSRSVFPTVTRLNTATLATGTYPARHGIVGNSMFVSTVNDTAPFDTGDYHTLLTLDATSGRVVTADTLGEMLQRHGKTLVTASSGSTGNGFLLNPEARHGAGVAINGMFERGTVAAYPARVSEAILGRFGPPPPDPDDLGQMRWTDTVLRDYALPELQPDVVIDWMGPLDSSQHADGVGSPAALGALREIDDSIGRTIAVLDALGLLPMTDLIVTSDHGFAHHTRGVDVVGALVAAGLKQSRTSTDVVVASQGQSLLFYVPGHEIARVRALVQFLQDAPWIDVIFTRGGRSGQGGVPGTFSFDVIQSDHPGRAADVIASLSWSPAMNAFGVPGSHTINSTTEGPLTGGASGHGGLAPWVVRNTFIAWGADFKAKTTIDAPVSLADVTPTVLDILGLADAWSPPTHGRGRVLHELLAGGPPARPTRRVLRTETGSYQAELEISSVDGHDYVGAGRRTR